MDVLLIFAQLVLGALGVLGVTASAPELLNEQLLSVVLSLGVAWGVSRVAPKRIAKVSPIIYVFVLISLVLVLFIGVSPDGSDAKRWLPLAGFTVQPSEFMKVTVIAYLAGFFYNHLGRWEIWRPMLVIALAMALILMQPNVSTAAFVFMLALTIMLAAGTTLQRLASISVSAALLAILVAGPYLSQYSYIEDRFAAVVDTWGEQEQADGISYQSVKAQRTLMKAGFFGIGPGRPVYVPESHTDMIAISIGQSLGFTGIISLVFLYIVIAGRGIRIAAVHNGPGSLLAAGATAYICGQAALNLLVATGYFPVTGVVLPFVSHGANNLISVSIAMGFLHSAYRQALKEGHEL